MSGNATFTIVTSIRSMKVPSDTVISGSHLRMPTSVSWFVAASNDLPICDD